MFLEYLLVLFRHLRKRANIAMINIVSYGFGIAAVLVLIQYIYFETGYEKFYEGHESVYRVALDNYYGGTYQNSTAFSFPPLGPELERRYPEVEAVTMASARLEVVTAAEKSFFEKRVLVADTNYLKVFSLPLQSGVLTDVNPNDVFISQATAIKYFGADDPIGKPMKVFRDLYTVKGIFKDLPPNTHLKFDILCLVGVRESNDWNVAYLYAYMKLNGSAEAFDHKLKDFSEEFSKLANEQSEADYSFQAKLQPLADIHLQSAMLDEIELNGRLEDIYILAVVVAMILLITCFNYINLTNAINSARAKETFVRKINGASYKNTVTQHIVESLALNVAGFAIAFALLAVFIKWIGPSYDFPVRVDWTSTTTWFTLLAIFLSALLLSGIIPALLSTSAQRGQFLNRVSGSHGVSGAFTRNIAFVQFVVSCVLISGALVVLKQVSFMREGDRGFSDEGVMALEVNPLSYRLNGEQFLKVKSDLEKIAAIERVSFSSCVPGERLINTSVRLATEPVDHTQNCDVQVITSDYFDVYGMEIVEGRMFSEDTVDLNSIVVNESLARKLGHGEDMVNREVTVDWARRPVNFRVVGVVKDYHHYSRRNEIPPMLFIPLRNSFSVFRISVKSVDKNNWKSNEFLVQKALKDHLTEPYSRRGIDVAYEVADVGLAYNLQYGSDVQFSRFLNALTVLAIAMAGIGFFSLSSTTTRKRTREIAIRKIFGARFVDMSALLSGYFIRLAGVAFVIALPISYFLTQDWLNQFPNRIEMGVWFVVWPLMITLGLTVLSISYFVLKLVFIDPAQQLRSE